jgi:hypothetical protein
MVRSTNAKIKTAKTVLASSVFLGMAFGAARAEICWRITPFADVIRATEITDNGNAPAGISGAPITSYLATGLTALLMNFHSWEL